MRAGKLPIQAISGTMGIMDGAAKVMKGLAAAGQAVVDEAVKAAESAKAPPPPSAAAARAQEAGDQHGQLTRQDPSHRQAGHGRFDRGIGEHHDHVVIGVHPRHRSAGGDLARRRLDDRLGHLHRLGGHRPAGLGLGPGRRCCSSGS